MTWSHLTMPLSTNGSAINNVIREVNREAARHGIASAVVASNRREYEFPDATLLEVDYTAHMAHEYFTRPEVALDAAAGRLGLPRRYARRTYRPAAEALRTTRGPVFVHEGHYATTAPALLRDTGCTAPLFLYVHARPSRTMDRRELRRLLAPVARVVCVSDAIRHHLDERLGSTELRGRLATVLNGVDVDRFSPRSEKVGQDCPPTILFVGAMIPDKGPDVLLAAVEILAREGHGFKARFVGSFTHGHGFALSEFERELRSRAETLGDWVEFRPFADHATIPDVYRSADVLVVPSQFDDPCPLVLLEGLASGLPVVGSPRGGIPELGLDAIQYADDAEELADRLATLLASESARSEWGTRARRRAEQLSWPSQFAELAAVVSPSATT